MPAERAGYTVTMFVIDVSPSMGKTRTIDLPDGPGGEQRAREITDLEWSLQFVMLKIQEMIFHGRKTEQCGVILFGTEDTENTIHDRNGGYDHVTEFIPIAQPNASTLARLASLRPSTVIGDPIDAIIVAVETQDEYLAKKKTWTRKMVLITDGGNPIEVEDHDLAQRKMNSLGVGLTIVGVDFDDEEFGYEEENKSHVKRVNEGFYTEFAAGMDNAIVGTCAFALQECVRPEVKETKSTLMGQVLRIGDAENHSDEAVEIIIKASKCTAVVRPPSLKKFARRVTEEEDAAIAKGEHFEIDDNAESIYAQMKMQTEYFIDGEEEEEEEEEEVSPEERARRNKERVDGLSKVEKEDLVRGFKYGASYVACPDGQFPRLETKKGIDVCGFFPQDNVRRDWFLGEMQYIWGDDKSPIQQVAFSSLVKAMDERSSVAIARWVTKDGMDPKMGILVPVLFDKVDCFLWAQMPFADDIRKYTFASLDSLVNKKGDIVMEHPYIPTQEQVDAMDGFVDSMDLMQAGEKDEEGNRAPWFDTRLSYNPAVHRIKAALFHAAVISDLRDNPIPPPHPELLKYFQPPKRVLKRAHDAIEEAKKVFHIKEVPKRVKRARKDDHVRAKDADDDVLLLDRPGPSTPSKKLETIRRPLEAEQSISNRDAVKKNDADSETEPESDDAMNVDDVPSSNSKNGKNKAKGLLTPERSASPHVDPGRAPGRIVGSTHPLQDFRDNLERGDVVSKTIEDLGVVLQEIVLKPFASRRNDELLECMYEFREVALKEDEIEGWNQFLRDMKRVCIQKSMPNNPAFWKEVQGQGPALGLISDEEAKEHGGSSNVQEQEVESFIGVV